MENNNTLFKLKALLFIPLGVYLFSYIYLGFYHGTAWLFDTIVHESGRHTLLKTILYASHSLGHIPVHTVLALFFAGAFLSLSRPCQDKRSLKINLILCTCLGIYLILCVFLSMHLWGQEDTLNFIAQQKQSEVTYGQGGSWNLHLPSTMLQFIMIPLYIYFAKILLRQDITLNANGVVYMLLSLFLFFVFAYLNNPNILANFRSVWQEPRYLAHSVREMVTFPLIYYPIPLYFMLRHHHQRSSRAEVAGRNTTYLMLILLAVFAVLFAYQCYVPLTKGIGALAQKPSFARTGQLSIMYLLTSHFFEHFLDTIYFSLICILFYFYSFNKRTKAA